MELAHTNPEVLDGPEPTNGTVVVRAVPFPVKVHNEAGRMSAAIVLTQNLGQEFDAAQIQVILKNAAEIIKHALELNTEACLAKLDQKETIIFGAKVTTRRTTEYDYSETPLVATIEGEIDAKKDKLKDLKEFLKNMPVDEMPDANTGEIFHKAKMTKNGIVPAVSLPK